MMAIKMYNRLFPSIRLDQCYYLKLKQSQSTKITKTENKKIIKLK